MALRSLKGRIWATGLFLTLVIAAAGAAFIYKYSLATSSAPVVLCAVSAISILSVLLATWYVSRLVTRPIADLVNSIDTLMLWELRQRAADSDIKELKPLSESVNRMAKALADFRRSNLGELVLAKETLEATLSALPDAVFIIAPDGTISSMNSRAQLVIAAFAPGVRKIDFIPFLANSLAEIRDALNDQKSAVRPMELARAQMLELDGRRTHFLPLIRTIRSTAADRHGAVVVFYDVSEFVKLDEIRTEMIAVASHELQTPLTTLRMNLMLLHEGASTLSPHQQEILNTALIGAEELANTINRQLDLTRIEAGQLKLALERSDVGFLVERCVGAVRTRFDDAGLKLIMQPVNQPVVAAVDGARLRTVISNILSNALKYTPYGGNITVEVSSRQNAGSGDRKKLRIAVTDTGPGIPEEYRERIFEKFFRVEPSSNAAVKPVRGTGIGLYLCRQIVMAHQGHVTCEPGLNGRGTRFVIVLPVERAEG